MKPILPGFHISPVDLADCDRLAPFTPPEWDDIPSKFRKHLNKAYAGARLSTDWPLMVLLMNQTEGVVV